MQEFSAPVCEKLDSATVSKSKPRILLIDDEADILDILSNLMQTAGYDAETVANGKGAIEKLEKEAFDLVISDIRMDTVSGIDVLASSRKLHPSMPFVLLTAYASDNTRREAQKLGVYAYLTKPFRMSVLLSTVERALGLTNGIGEEDDR